MSNNKPKSYRSAITSIFVATTLVFFLSNCSQQTSTENFESPETIADDSEYKSTHSPLKDYPQLTSSPEFEITTVGSGGILSVNVPVDQETDVIQAALAYIDKDSKQPKIVDTTMTSARKVGQGMQLVNLNIRIPINLDVHPSYRVLFRLCSASYTFTGMNLSDCSEGPTSIYEVSIIDGKFGNRYQYRYSDGRYGGVTVISGTATQSDERPFTDFVAQPIKVDTSNKSVGNNLGISLSIPASTVSISSFNSNFQLFDANGKMVAGLNTFINSDSESQSEQLVELENIVSQTNKSWNTFGVYTTYNKGDYILYVWLDTDGVYGITSNDYGISYPISINGATAVRFTTDSNYDGIDKTLLPKLNNATGLIGTNSTIKLTDDKPVVCTWHLPNVDIYSEKYFVGPLLSQITTAASGGFTYNKPSTWFTGSWDLYCWVDVDLSNTRNSGDLVYRSPTPFTLTNTPIDVGNFVFSTVP